VPPAGSTVATRRAKGRVVTVAITAMTFHRPVFVGDEVSCYVEIVKIGRTSTRRPKKSPGASSRGSRWPQMGVGRGRLLRSPDRQLH
jgi:acyl dehydratase